MDSHCLSLVLALFSVFLVFRLVTCQPTGPPPQPFSSPATCAAETEFYRTGDLMCTACSANQTVSEDGLSCRCVSGYYRPVASRTSNFACQPCTETNTVASHDGLFCLLCGNGTEYDLITRNCRRCSSSTEIFVDSLPPSQNDVGTRSCTPCPLGTWADESGFTCVECGVPNCDQCTVMSGGVCLMPSESLPSPPATAFRYYTENFAAATELCRTTSNATACQLVANLCVLQNYFRSDPACAQSLLLAGEYLPLLYYAERAAQQIIKETDIQTRLLTKDGFDGTTTLPLVLASFSLNGTFLGLDEEETEKIIICRDRPSRSHAAWRIGVQYQIKCSLSVLELTKQASSPVFYDLFFRDIHSDSDQLIPIPVLVTNYRTPSLEAVNERRHRGRWQLVRRFFLAESVTTAPQYVEKMKLEVELTSNGIYLPFLTVTYSSWTPNPASTETLQSSYSTVYTGPSKPIIIGLSVTASIFFLGMLSYAGIRTNGFLRRTGSLFCQFHPFLYYGLEMCSGLSTMLFILLTVASTFHLVFFKVKLLTQHPTMTLTI